jgi:DNA-binding XRE family transcriptional regulator
LLKRIEANLSQPEIGTKAGVSAWTVRKWEHGHGCPTEDHWQVLTKLERVESQTPARSLNPLNPLTEDFTEGFWAVFVNGIEPLCLFIKPIPE